MIRQHRLLWSRAVVAAVSTDHNNPWRCGIRIRRAYHDWNKHNTDGRGSKKGLSSFRRVRTFATQQQQQHQQRQQQQQQQRVVEERSSQRGLFSITELQTPADFVKLAAIAVTQCDSLRQQVATMMMTQIANVQDAKHLLFVLDRISQTVCNVIDAAELARSTHADPLWRDAADRAFGVLSDYIAQLNSDVTLHAALRLVVKTSDATSSRIWDALTNEEKRFAILLQAEFERDGIHLPDVKRQQVRQLQNQLTELETIFARNIVVSKQEFMADAADVEAVIPPHVLQSFGIMEIPMTTANGNSGSDSSNSDHDRRFLRLSNNIPQILQTLTKYSSSPNLRKQIYIEAMTAVPENLPILEALAAKRHELSQVLGFESYADRCLRDKMAQNPRTVSEFLRRLQARIQPSFKKEMELLSNLKQRMEHNGTIEPWDISFYVGLLKSRDGHDLNSISEYLTLRNCLEGMALLVDRLFGIRMIEEATDFTERWDVPSSSRNREAASPLLASRSTSGTSHTQVRRFLFEDNDGRPLGTLYLDLFPREGKYTHAAHFTIRCGCLANSNNDGDSNDELARYQLPIVALVCNLSGSSMDAPLSHGEVETLFHEFGHGLHSLLSRTKFQHMSGTRAAMDFVETPSHLMENYVWDAEFLQILGRHHHHGGPIPDALIDALRKSRYEFAAIEQQNQVLYALFDQKLFGARDLTQPQTSTQIFAGLHHELGIPYTDGTHWHSRFGHLVSYGAGYYGYLYAQVFARDIWKSVFEGDSLNRSAGNRLWQHLLMHGGAKDPTLLLHDLLGRPPQVDYYA